MKEIIQSQYGAALTMLVSSIEQCSGPLWTDSRYKNPCWHVAYHVLFYTDLYLQIEEDAFRPSPLHRDGYDDLARKDLPVLAGDDVLDYARDVLRRMPAAVAAVDLESTESGFPWLPFGKLEVQLYNVRHVQHHMAQLADRIRNDLDLPTRWVGRWPPTPTS